MSVSRELAKILEFSEAAAHADMFRVAPPEFGFEVDETSEYVARLAPAMDIMMFNRAVGLGSEYSCIKNNGRRSCAALSR